MKLGEVLVMVANEKAVMKYSFKVVLSVSLAGEHHMFAQNQGDRWVLKRTHCRISHLRSAGAVGRTSKKTWLIFCGGSYSFLNVPGQTGHDTRRSCVTMCLAGYTM